MSIFSYTRQERINDALGFKAVLNSRIKLVKAAFVIYIRKTRTNNSKLGVIIQKKLIRKAHMRNQVRRIIRESFRLNKHNLVNKEVVVIARHKAQYLSKHELRQALDKEWSTIATSHSD